ncbi:MAG: MBOAT family protein [Lawsonibacter sp.]|nr:MBOAT family protein [Lawsonibacter sp.]
MAFTSLSFLALTGVGLCLYCLAPAGGRWLVLLGASLVFYCSGGGWTVGYVLYTTLTVYLSGLLLGWLNERKRAAPPERKKEAAARYKTCRRLVVLAACLLNFGLLYVLKYWNFTAQLLQPLADRLAGGARLPLSSLLLPLGVSFFMFQSVGYVIDVYRAKYPPERNFAKLLLFVSFFPQMVQGPISRFGQLAPQLLKKERPSCDDVKYGIQLALWGYLKKLVLADRAAVLVNTVMDGPWRFGGAVQGTAILFYCVQLYCDFSGGIDITRGAAQMFGIHMAENFRRPLFAASLTDFWRRWHITLGGWMRDYLFYPLSLSKPFGRLGKWSRKHIGGTLGKILPTSLATFLVYFVIGVWHGANWRYIAFGFWNGTLITLALLMAPWFQRWKTALHIQETAPWYRLFQIARTCFLVFLGRYLTRAPRLLTGLWMVKQTFLHPRLSELWDGTLLTLGLGGFDLAVIGLGTAVLVGVEWFQERGGQVRKTLERQSFLVQWLALFLPLAALLCLGILRAEYISSGFLYQQY